jgi:5'-deoxynucleotidase YfbR-like HD superfamily hydrolase
MTNIRILVQEGMKKALKAAQQPSLSKRDVRTILKAVASQARRIKEMDDELPFGAETSDYKKKTPKQRKEMQKSYDSLRANIARLGAPFPEGSPAALLRGDKFGRPNVDPFERGTRIERGYPPEASGREKLSTTERGAGFISVDGSKLPTMPGAPRELNKALKNLPDKVGRTVYDPMPFGPVGGPLQPDKKLTARMRGLEGLMKKYSQTSAGYPTRKMAAELEAHKKIASLKDVQNYMKRLKQKKKLREKLPNALVPPMIQSESVDNPQDGADVVSNFYSEREGDSTRKKVKKKVGKLSPKEQLLLRQMQMQSATALGRTRAKYGTDIVPQPKAPKPINFQAEAVEARYKRLKKARDKKIAKDPRVGLHGPSHPMFHRSDLAKRVRQLALQIKTKSRGKLNG